MDEKHWAAVRQLVMEVHESEEDGSGGRLDRVRAELEGRGFQVEVEQPALLEGTDRYNLWAVRPDDPVTGEPVVDGEAVAPELLAAAEELGQGELRSFLRRRLPEPMVPSAVVWLDELPLNANGKVDRGRLPDPSEAARQRPHVPPRDDLERQLCEIWQEVFEVERIGVEDDFFELGGHSLLATRVAARMRERLGAGLPIRRLFDLTTVALQAEALKAEHGEGLGGGGELPAATAQATPSAAVEPSMDDLLAELEEMSDEEAAALAEEVH